MINSLYEPFEKWANTGSVYIISDTHFEDSDCKLMNPNWISPSEQVNILKRYVHKNDTLIHLGDVGNPEYLTSIPGYKVLILGNHDGSAQKFKPYFDEIYTGALLIAKNILLSHEPVYGLEEWCINIHGHVHNGKSTDSHINLAADVCGYTPISLGEKIKAGILSKTQSLHRIAINKQKEEHFNEIK